MFLPVDFTIVVPIFEKSPSKQPSKIRYPFLENVLLLTVNKKVNGIISSDEIGLPMKDSEMILPCGIYARWEKEQ